MHAPVEWNLYDLSEVHHVTAKDKEIFMLVEKDYPLRRGLALVMISYRLQVKNHSQMAKDLIKKIYNIANTLRKQKIIHETTKKIMQIRQRFKLQETGREAMPIKQEKLNPRYIRPFKILEQISLVAYKLELPEELSNVHSTFYFSNLKKCLSDESLVIPMKELWLDDKLNFVEEPVEVMDRVVKQLKQSRIPIVKVRWNSKRGP
nr:putative reverse transcriptase domain-containing protein [Tanacetum cinerariifolium]